LDLLKTSEMVEQRLPTGRTDTGNILEDRIQPGPTPTQTMPSDGKSVCLIPDLLNKMKSR
jgi:hypothetical protein